MALVEALVALAVMAFGMLGVVGMQSTLRFNSDLSRQRSEALRLAQEEVERLRSYTQLEAAASADVLGFEEIVSSGADEEIDGANALFRRSVVVDLSPETTLVVRHRNIRVRVAWNDRRGDEQEVTLRTQINYAPLDMSALPSRRGDRGVLARPGGRHPAIPRGAVSIDAARSVFSPPGGAGISWIFNNDTGLITQVCTAGEPPSCTDQNRALVSGYVAFALVGAPDPAAAESPLSDRPTELAGFGIQVRYTHTTTRPFVLGSTETCYVTPSVALSTKRSTYYCAVPLSGSGVLAGTWTGVLVFTGIDSLLAADPIGGPLTINDPLKFRVCRYTPRRENYNSLLPDPVYPTGVPASEFNRQHPWQYRFAGESYANRNFVMIPAGAGTGDGYGCPDDAPGTPIQSSTWHHARP